MNSNDEEEEETGWPASMSEKSRANVRALCIACRLIDSHHVLQIGGYRPHVMFNANLGKLKRVIDNCHPKQKEKFLAVYFNALIQR